MKKLKVVILMIFVTNLILAQSDIVNYNEYVFPEFKFRSLQADMDIFGNSNKSSNFFSEQYTSQFNVEGNLTGQMNEYNNTTQNINTFFLNNTLNRQKHIEDTTLLYDLDIYISTLNRKFSERNKFREFSIGANISPSYEKVSKQNKENNLRTNIDVEYMLGKGRIDPINYILAIQFIVDELLEERILTENPSQEVIFNLADELTILSNKRVFDSRIRRRFIVNSLVDYFRNNILFDKERVHELTSIIMDNVYIFPVSNRQRGKSIAYGISLDYDYYNFKSNTIINTFKFDDFTTGLLLRRRSYKQLNKNFQIFHGVDARLGYTTQFIKSDFDFNSINPSLSYNFGVLYNPSTRTVIELKTYAEVASEFKFIPDHIINLPNESLNYFLNCALDYRYFINFNTALSGNFNFYLNRNIQFDSSSISKYDLFSMYLGAAYFFY